MKKIDHQKDKILKILEIIMIIIIARKLVNQEKVIWNVNKFDLWGF